MSLGHVCSYPILETNKLLKMCFVFVFCSNNFRLFLGIIVKTIPIFPVRSASVTFTFLRIYTNIGFTLCNLQFNIIYIKLYISYFRSEEINEEEFEEVEEIDCKNEIGDTCECHVCTAPASGTSGPSSEPLFPPTTVSSTVTSSSLYPHLYNLPKRDRLGRFC